MPVLRRASSGPKISARPKQTIVSTIRAPAPVPQSTAGSGSPALCRATATIPAALSPAHQPSTAPAAGQTRPTSPPSSPSTVAGATSGAARRLAATATKLT